jgi:hypothetical protein
MPTCIVTLLILAAPTVAAAQEKTHAYAVIGAGPPMVLGGGVDCLIAGTRVGVLGEYGLLGLALGGTFHRLARSKTRLDIFTSASYVAFTDLNGEDTGVRLGGGLVYWNHRHIGYRVDAYAIVLIRDEINTMPEHWSVRAGVAFGFR